MNFQTVKYICFQNSFVKRGQDHNYNVAAEYSNLSFPPPIKAASQKKPVALFLSPSIGILQNIARSLRHTLAYTSYIHTARPLDYIVMQSATSHMHFHGQGSAGSLARAFLTARHTLCASRGICKRRRYVCVRERCRVYKILLLV